MLGLAADGAMAIDGQSLKGHVDKSTMPMKPIFWTILLILSGTAACSLAISAQDIDQQVAQMREMNAHLALIGHELDTLNHQLADGGTDDNSFEGVPVPQGWTLKSEMPPLMCTQHECCAAEWRGQEVVKELALGESCPAILPDADNDKGNL